jgi:DNA processing protein
MTAGSETVTSTERVAERLARVALCRFSEPGHQHLSTLVARLGAVRVRDFMADQRGLDGTLDDLATRLVAVDPERELDQAARLGIRFLIPGDDEWPAQVDDLVDAQPLQDLGGIPLGLWVKGPLRLDQLTASVAVVGSRSATSYGADVAASLSADVASAGIAVVSGAAFGIDQAAHRGALAGRGRTVAVLACGVDRAYPTAHRQLLDHLAQHGAVVSELAPGCSPTRIRFLARNRLIAALTQGTVVVEAALRSGALNTANWADRLSRRLMAVPGPVTSAPSAGAHQLIRSGAAALVTSGPEVRELLGASGESTLVEPRGPERTRDRLPKKDARVLEAVPVSRPAETDSIARTAGVPLVQAQSALTRLAREDFVVRTVHGWVLGKAGLA